MNLANGLAPVYFNVGDATLIRYVFASRTDDVIAMHVYCDKPGRISLAANLSREAHAKTEFVAPDRLVMRGQCDGGKGMRFEAHLKAIAMGGTVSGEGSQLRVEKADWITLLLAANTDHVLDPSKNYRGKDPAALCEHEIAEASEKSYDALWQAHKREHERLFRRVDLYLGGQGASEARLPTDERLREFARTGNDPHLIATYFQYGRYLLMSSSRPGRLPANLQGLWAEGLAAAVELRLPRQHQRADELLAGRGLQPGRVPPAHDRPDPLPGGARGARPLRPTTAPAAGSVHTITNVWGFTSPG